VEQGRGSSWEEIVAVWVNMQKPVMKVCCGFFAVCKGQMGVVGKRAKMEKKEEKFHGCLQRSFLTYELTGYLI
jgi:hypothetical protein